MEYNFISSKRIMAQLLRRTKKCCVKLLRKLSFSNASSPSASPTYRGTSQKCCRRKLYVQQINRTPNRCKIAPSPDHYASNVNAFASKSSVDKECRNSCILDDFHHSNSINNNNNNKSQRNKSNLSRIFRIRQSTLSKQTNNKNKHVCNLTTTKCKNSNDDYSNLHDIQNNNNNNMNKQNIECSMATISPISSSISSVISPSPLIFEDEEIIFTENQIYIGINEHHYHHHHHRHGKNGTNLNEKTCEPNKKFQEKSTFDLFTGNIFNSSKNKNNNGTYRKGTCKTGGGCCDDADSDHENMFEKIKTDKSKKPSAFSSMLMGNECFYDSNNDINGHSVNFNGTSSKSKSKQIAKQHFLFDSNLDLSYDDGLKCTSAFDHEVDNSPTKRLSEYDNLNETFCLSHAMCSKQNSSNRNKYLADNNDSGYGNGTYAETWDFLNSKPIHTPSTPSSTTASTTNRPLSKKLYEIHYETAVSGSSRRTSISTIETWIDDELFDNSFNEELEKRCASLTTSPYH